MKNAASSLISGFLSSLGLGGGGILVLYLILFLKEEQIAAQGINLLFFVPCAAISTAIYSLNGLIDYKSVFITFLGGIPGIFLSNYLLTLVDSILVAKIFGLFLIISGVKSLFNKKN